MKNLWKYFMTMAVAVVALSACQKEFEQKTTSKEGTLKISVKASAEAVQGEAGTKTYIDGTAIKWGTGEYMKIGVYDGTATTFGNSTDESADIWIGEKEAMFNFSITPANTADEYTYYGLYPASAAVASNNTNPESYKVNLPAAQNATATSYDPKAYILVAKPEGGKTITSTDWEASFRRATALNKVTLQNLPEAIKRVTITAPNNVYLAGARHINLTTGASDDIYSGGGRTNKVSVKFDQAQASGSDVIVWFTSWDASIAVDSKLTIVAYSEAHTYTRELTVVNKPITFTEGKLNTLKVNMATADQGDNTEFAAGTYVVLAKDGTNYYALKAEKEENKERLLSVAYTGDLTSYNGSGDIIWNISESEDSFIFENSGKYLGYKGTGNESYWLEADDDWTTANYLLSITAQETSGLYHVTLNANASRYLSKNSSAAFFAFYGNTGQKADIVFVPATVDNRADVTLAFEDEDINCTTADYDNFFGQEDVTVTPDVEAITKHLEWSYEDNDGVIDEFDNGALTLTGTVGTATVTVSFAGDTNYKPASASYTITVTDGSTPTPSGDVFMRITSTDELTLGTDAEYLLIYVPSDGDALAFNGSLESGYNGSAGVTVVFDDSGNVDYDTYKAYALTISQSTTTSKYWIKTAGGKFIGRNANSNGVDEYTPTTESPTPGSNYNNGIAFNENTGVVSITGNGGRALLYYPNNSNYKYYAPGNVANMYLYKFEDASTNWNLSSIAVKTAPNKVVYEEGENFDPAGLVITATYYHVYGEKPDKTVDVAYSSLNANDFTFSPTTSTALTTSNNEVSITWHDKTTSQPITVNAPVAWTLKSIEVKTAPSKVTYVAGEFFDPTGLVLTATYEATGQSDKTEDIVYGNENASDFTFSPDTNTALDTGNDEVIISWGGQNAALPITVNATATYDFETIAQLNGLVTSTSSDYKGYLTDAVVSFVPTTGTAFVKDATGTVMIYKSSHGLKQGQTYTGAINVTAVQYNSLYSEITAWDATFTGDETAVDPESVSLADLIGHYDDYQNAYVQVAGLTVESVSSKNISVTDGTNTYVVFDNPGSATCGQGDVITVKGTVTKYNTTEEIKVWAAADITVTGSAPKAITFSQPSQTGCSFTVSVDDQTITSGATVEAGKTVTLTATAGTDYTFHSWTVSGATLADASAATTTFTMGTSAVSISASFTSTGGGGSDPVTLVNETFDSGNSSIDTKLSLTNPTGSATGFARLGTSKANGAITCTIPKASASEKTLTVSFDANAWSTNEKTLTVTVTNGTATSGTTALSSITLSTTIGGTTSSPSFNTTCDKVSFTVTPNDNLSADVVITITGAKRFLVDNYKVVAE